MKRMVLFLALLMPLTLVGQSSMRSHKRNTESLIREASARQSAKQSIELPPAQPVDTLLTPDIPFTPMEVSMHGYGKRLSDAHESFILRNETHNYRISRVWLKIVYTTQEGSELHHRDEVVECDLLPGKSQTVTIQSFDKAKSFYYYTTPPRGASGTPYRIKYDILRYDVVVQNISE